MFTGEPSEYLSQVQYSENTSENCLTIFQVYFPNTFSALIGHFVSSQLMACQCGVSDVRAMQVCQRTLARAVPIITGDKQTSISTQLLVLSIDFGSSVSTKRGCSSWINLATSLLHKPRAIMALAQTFLHSLFKLPHLYDRVFIKVVSYSTLNLRGLYILSQRNE